MSLIVSNLKQNVSQLTQPFKQSTLWSSLQSGSKIQDPIQKSRKKKVKSYTLSIYGVHSPKKFSYVHKRKTMNPFAGKFTDHSSIKISVWFNSSDDSLTENGSLLTSFQKEKRKIIFITTLGSWMRCWKMSNGWQGTVSSLTNPQRLSSRSWRRQLDSTRPQSQLMEAQWEDKQRTTLSDDSANLLIHTISNSNHCFKFVWTNETKTVWSKENTRLFNSYVTET